MDQRQCPKCSQMIPSDAKFCPECGTPISAPPPGKAPAAVASPKKSTAIRDGAIIIGALAVVSAGYFLLKEKPEPPLPSPTTEAPVQAQSKSPSQGTSSAQPPHQGMDGMSAAVLDSLPKDYNSLVLKGNTYMDQGQFAVAAECYRRALAASDESQDVRVDYGACLHAMGLPDRALEEFRRVLSKNPKHGIATFNMGIVFNETGVKDSSTYYLKKYLVLDPNGRAAGQAKELLKANGG